MAMSCDEKHSTRGKSSSCGVKASGGEERGGLRNKRARGGELIHHRPRKYTGLLRVTATRQKVSVLRRCRATLAQGKGPFQKWFIRADLLQFSSVSAETHEYELVSQTPALKLAAVTTVSLLSKHVMSTS